MAKAQVVSGFGIEKSLVSKSFENKEFTFRQMKLLAVIVGKVPAARGFLGMSQNQGLNWQYKGWSPDMVKRAHECINNFVSQLPAKGSGRF